MILFRFPNYDPIARRLSTIPGLTLGQFAIARYGNQEWHALLRTRVSGEHCLILGSIAPPDEQLLSFLLLGHTLRKEGAHKLTALLPYFAYSRQDKDKPGESLGTAWIGLLLRSSGFDEVYTVDVHSERDKALCPVPIVSLSAAGIVAEAIHTYGLGDATIVAPDNGAIARCEAVKRAAKMPATRTPFFEKKRTESGIIHQGPFGEVGARAVIIDDMLDTGATLVSACQKLAEVNVQEIYVLVTHGLFTGTAWKQLWSLRVRRIFCTDTVPLSADIDATTNITVLSVAPLLQDRLASVMKGGVLANGNS
jgi:ribose-phosphate pyrophosphokinase